MNLKTLISELDNKWILFYLLLYVSLIIGFIFGENSTGGAIKDYINQKNIALDFKGSFYETLFNYDKYNTRHSPVLVIFLSLFEKINLNDFIIRFVHLNLCLILPFYFYKSLLLIFKNKNITLFLVALIFISPTFRSLAIWPDSRLLGLTFFTISVYEYLKFNKDKRLINCLKNIIFLSISSYISPNFSLFAIFYFFNFVIYYRQNLRIVTLIIFLNIILSIPAFIYLFSLESNFLATAAVKGQNSTSNLFVNNIFNNVLLIFSIIFFYLIPFSILKIFNLKLNKNIFKLTTITIIIFLICIFNFNYKNEYTGGGIIFKLFYVFLETEYLFFLLLIISIFIVLTFSDLKFNNLILLIILILSNPQITVYHKYYDPLLLILFFTLFNISINIKNFEKIKNRIFVFTYFLIFLILNNLKTHVL